MVLILIVIIYLICSVLAFGFTRADWDANFPDGGRDNLSMPMLDALLGPLGLVISFICTGAWQHGFSLTKRKPKSKKSKHEINPPPAVEEGFSEQHWLDYKVGAWREDSHKRATRH